MKIDLMKLELDNYTQDAVISKSYDVLFKQNGQERYEVRVSLADNGEKEDHTDDYVVVTYLDSNMIIKQTVYDVSWFLYETHDGESVINEYFDYKSLKKCVEDFL